jgi:Tol biopolymer transport system component
MYVETIDLRTREISKIPGSEELWSPRWSGDGLHILAMPRAQRGLMLFDIKTQKWTALDSLAKMFVNWPEWSRRGDYIYFYGTPIGTEESVFRVRISDGKLDKIFGLSNFQQAAGWTWKGLAPDDSPLLTRDAGTMDIYALDVDFP